MVDLLLLITMVDLCWLIHMNSTENSIINDWNLESLGFIWVNCSNSLTWIVGPYKGMIPLEKLWFPMKEKSEVVIIYTDLSKCWQECRWKINENGPEYEKSAVSGKNSLLPLGQMYVLYIMIIFYHLEWLKSWSTTILQIRQTVPVDELLKWACQKVLGILF